MSLRGNVSGGDASFSIVELALSRKSIVYIMDVNVNVERMKAFKSRRRGPPNPVDAFM